MGASGWSYFVPYQADVNAALQALRLQVFQQGDYYKLWEATDPEPATIDEAMERNEDSGTHSILDINGIASMPGEFGTISPLTDAQLQDLFGTLQPSHQEVQKLMDTYDRYSRLHDLRKRFEGSYFIIYETGQPHEIFFVGFSGD